MMACGFPFCFSPARQLGTVDLVSFPACLAHCSLLPSPTRSLLPPSLTDSLLVPTSCPRPVSHSIALQLEEQGRLEEAAECWSQYLTQCEDTSLEAEAAYRLGTS